MKENNNLKQKSKLMIGLFSFLGIMMVFAIATTNLTSKGTYSKQVEGSDDIVGTPKGSTNPTTNTNTTKPTTNTTRAKAQ